MNGASERRRTKQRHPINLPFQIVVDCLLQTVFDHSIEFQKINVTNSTKTFNIMIIIPGKGTKRKKMLEMKLCACFKLQQFFLWPFIRNVAFVPNRNERYGMKKKKKLKENGKKQRKSLEIEILSRTNAIQFISIVFNVFTSKIIVFFFYV